MDNKELQDKQLKEQSEKVASKDDFPIFWIDRISLFLSHTIKYLIPVIVLVMMYEIFMKISYIITSTITGIKYFIVWLKNREILSIQNIGKSSLLATFSLCSFNCLS